MRYHVMSTTGFENRNGKFRRDERLVSRFTYGLLVLFAIASMSLASPVVISDVAEPARATTD